MRTTHLFAALGAVVVVVVVVVVLVAGNGGSDASKTTTTVATVASIYCADVNALRASLESFRSLKPDASLVVEGPARIDALTASFNRLKASGSKEFGPKLDAVQKNLDVLREDVTSVSTPADIASALNTVPDEVKTLIASVTDLVSSTQTACTS